MQASWYSPGSSGQKLWVITPGVLTTTRFTRLLPLWRMSSRYCSAPPTSMVRVTPLLTSVSSVLRAMAGPSDAPLKVMVRLPDTGWPSTTLSTVMVSVRSYQLEV